MDSILFLLNSTPSSSNAARAFESSLRLKTGGYHVSLCLLQDAVLAGVATPNGANTHTARALQAGISIYALDEDLELRGFTAHKLYAGVCAADYPALIDLFERHTRVIGAL